MEYFERWIGSNFDYIIDNTSSLEGLNANVDQFIRQLQDRQSSNPKKVINRTKYQHNALGIARAGYQVICEYQMHCARYLATFSPPNRTEYQMQCTR